MVDHNILLSCGIISKHLEVSYWLRDVLAHSGVSQVSVLGRLVHFLYAADLIEVIMAIKAQVVRNHLAAQGSLRCRVVFL